MQAAVRDQPPCKLGSELGGTPFLGLYAALRKATQHSQEPWSEGVRFGKHKKHSPLAIRRPKTQREKVPQRSHNSISAKPRRATTRQSPRCPSTAQVSHERTQAESKCPVIIACNLCCSLEDLGTVSDHELVQLGSLGLGGELWVDRWLHTFLTHGSLA